MDRLDEARRDERIGDLERVAAEVGERLRTRGVDVLPTDTPEDVAALLDAVEGFERTVEEQGGDLMMAEPPELGGDEVEPDENQFVLPKRRANESAPDYVHRLELATEAVRQFGLDPGVSD